MRVLKTLTAMIAALLLFYPGACTAQISKTLAENTRITPPGVIVAIRGDIPMFKKGTIVILNDFGEVLEGVLAEDISLPYETGDATGPARAAYYIPTPQPPIIIAPRPAPAPPPIFIPNVVTDMAPQIRVLNFKGGTKIVFNDRGEAVRGTVSTNQLINLNPTNSITVSSAEISFHKNGMVATCTLNNDSYLRPVGWMEILTDNFTDRITCSGFVEFKGGKPVELNDKGEVVKGTLENDTKLASDNIIVPGISGKKLFKAGTAVEFDDKGKVVKTQEP